MNNKSDYAWKLDVNDSEISRIRTFAEEQAPWRVQIHFGDHFNTGDFGKARRFVEVPLFKAIQVDNHLPDNFFQDAHILDVGFNYGYSGQYFAKKYGCSVTGIDMQQSMKDAAEFIADIQGINAEYILEDAHTFCRPEQFDLILHFGTLYHLEHPFLALKNAIKSLKPGGYLALQTIMYTGEEHLNKWINGFNNDRTNFWAIHEKTLESFIKLNDCSPLQVIFRRYGKKLHTEDEKLARCLYLFQKNK